MKTHEKALASAMLKDYSNVLGNRCCNDFEFPSDWSKQQKIDFVKEYHDWNGDPEVFNPDVPILPDFAVASFLAWKIRLRDKAQ